MSHPIEHNPADGQHAFTLLDARFEVHGLRHALKSVGTVGGYAAARLRCERELGKQKD